MWTSGGGETDLALLKLTMLWTAIIVGKLVFTEYICYRSLLRDCVFKI